MSTKYKVFMTIFFQPVAIAWCWWRCWGMELSNKWNIWWHEKCNLQRVVSSENKRFFGEMSTWIRRAKKEWTSAATPFFACLCDSYTKHFLYTWHEGEQSPSPPKSAASVPLFTTVVSTIAAAFACASVLKFKKAPIWTADWELVRRQLPPTYQDVFTWKNSFFVQVHTCIIQDQIKKVS